MSEVLPPEKFYKVLSNEYEIMTNDSKRWSRTTEQFNNIFGDLKVKRILDAGCGTGGEAISLAVDGFDVTGIDITKDFIAIANSKAAKAGVKVTFQVDDLTTLKSLVGERFDCVSCRGNTLPHILTEIEIRKMFSSFSALTNEGGLLILQWLNYRKILQEKKRLVGVTGTSSSPYLRFYDFISENEILFNIARLKHDKKWETEWSSTKLRPWTADDVGMIVRQCGWRDLQVYADMQKSEFDPDNSKDVLLIATKEE